MPPAAWQGPDIKNLKPETVRLISFTARGNYRTDVALAKLSMDGRGAWRDNVFVERLWRTIKYEHVYKHVYASVADARTLIASHIDWYNDERQHEPVRNFVFEA